LLAVKALLRKTYRTPSHLGIGDESITFLESYASTRMVLKIGPWMPAQSILPKARRVVWRFVPEKCAKSAKSADLMCCLTNVNFYSIFSTAWFHGRDLWI
jgi:hypothetical protein